MKIQSGFTLIELVVVMIILGILATTAIPKFTDMQSDAREASLQALLGTLESANSLVYSKAIIDEQEELEEGSVEVTGDSIITTFGYIQGTELALNNAIDADFDTLWIVTEYSGAAIDTDSTENIYISHSGAPNDGENCRINYQTPAVSGFPPEYIMTVSEC
ncbi:MAG: type II secretion system protein [Colwellia sp.]